MGLFRKRRKGADLSDGLFADVQYNNRTFTFMITHPEDHIQGFHKSGSFYDIEELELIKDHLGDLQLRVADVGANVGNHTVFFAHNLNCEKIFPIEPNPAVTRTLKANIGLNWHRSIDPEFVGFGLSAKNGFAIIGSTDLRNTGGSEIALAAGGRIPVIRGDDFCRRSNINFMKIDVEGHEDSVLDGLNETLRDLRPAIYIETRGNSASSVPERLSALGYRDVFIYSRYEGVVNFMFEPAERISS